MKSAVMLYLAFWFAAVSAWLTAVIVDGSAHAWGLDGC